MQKEIYKITKTDEELRSLIRKLENTLSEEDFSDFCNIVISRAVKCWQSGLEDYPFGKKRYSDWQCKETILNILEIQTTKTGYDYSYTLYIKESLCLYHKIYQREQKLKRITK